MDGLTLFLKGYVESYSMAEVEANTLPCADKMVFDTFKEAEATGLAADWQHGASLKAYKCRHCQLYHLSSRSPE